MATEYVTIRHRVNGEEKRVAKTAAVFFPDYVVLDSAGRTSAHQPTPDTNKKD